MSARVLFYVQHLLGVGHLRRAEIIAEAMAASGLDVTIAFGGVAVPEVPFRAVRVAPLPAATIANEDFSRLLDEAGTPVDEAWRETRRAALLDLCRQTRPDVVLIELFPFGRRQFRFELLPLLEAVESTQPKPFVACSVRDVLVASRRPGRDDEIVTTLRRFFDAVFVHGDPAFIPFEATFAAADRIADLIRYTGYIVAPAYNAPAAEGHGEVLVSAGGGAVGGPLLLAAMAARPMTALSDRVWRFLTGPNLPPTDLRTLAAAAGARTIVERFRPDFPQRLRVAALSISQAGYNTTMDILRAGARAVVIPYETAGETEQRLRADVLGRKGLLTVLPAGELSPEALAAAIAAALSKPNANAVTPALSGAARTAAIVWAFAEQKQRAG